MGSRFIQFCLLLANIVHLFSSIRIVAEKRRVFLYNLPLFLQVNYGCRLYSVHSLSSPDWIVGLFALSCVFFEKVFEPSVGHQNVPIMWQLPSGKVIKFTSLRLRKLRWIYHSLKESVDICCKEWLVDFKLWKSVSSALLKDVRALYLFIFCSEISFQSTEIQEWWCCCSWSSVNSMI